MVTDDAPRQEYPRPQLRRDDWRSLNGEWEFEIDHGRTGRARGLPTAADLERTITVPFPPESELSGVDHRDFMDAVWYRREVEVTEEDLAGRLLLHFGAVDYEAEVWLNGESVGTHRGGYTPFTFDVTDHVETGSNVLTVCARDEVRTETQPAGKQSKRYDSHGAVYTRITGIWQPVWLEPVPETSVEDLRIDPNLPDGTVHLTASLRGDPRGTELTVTATFDGDTVGEVSTPVAGETARCVVDVDEVHPWTPESPDLYDLAVTLRRDGEVVDEVESYTGLRSVSVEDGVVLLNGEPRFQRLILDQGYYPEGLYTAPSDDALRRDIELGMEMGFDGARLHEKVFEPRYLYHADRLGYLVWGEHANWGLDHSDPSNLAPFLQEWIEVVERDYNHPSLVGWTPFNETTSDQDDNLLRTVYRTTKALDPTRPVVDTSGYVHVETDLLDVHDYTQDVDEFRERYDALEAGESVTLDYGDGEYGPELSYVSEYGGIWWNPGAEEGWGYGDRPESVDEFVDRYRGLTEALLDNEAIGLLCYTQLYDIEQEANGLFTYDRESKFDPERERELRDIMRQPAAVERND
ncbi:glycoside hydrolase family 2 protein [Candidatus Halobonum tyrrellensis]|uniref:Beta-galactosidase n=1 Tax=Candidatus Halobonum tyrrellensis G22 TaxID=1324957 RepID=V4J2Y2_9EURY|nr:sugar-binding domain-containing protein [Candidatus Halobonum tyrrellensis]ESP89757.1 beta-galactosidase [Candidatus Halobonum tyrrellensis G22]